MGGETKNISANGGDQRQKKKPQSDQGSPPLRALLVFCILILSIRHVVAFEIKRTTPTWRAHSCSIRTWFFRYTEWQSIVGLPRWTFGLWV